MKVQFTITAILCDFTEKISDHTNKVKRLCKSIYLTLKPFIFIIEKDARQLLSIELRT